MSWWDGRSAEEEAIDEAHDQGQKDGASGKSGFEVCATSATYAVWGGERVAEAYQAGLENGRNNPSKED